MALKTKRRLFAAGTAALFMALAALAHAQQSPYYGVRQNSASGTAAGHISGSWGVAASSQAPSAYSVYLDGVNGRVGIGMGDAPLYPLDLNGYGVLRSSAAVYGTLGVGYAYSSLFTGAKLNINSQGGYALALHPRAGVDGYYIYPLENDALYIRTTGGSSNTRRLVVGNSGSSYGALSLSVYGGDQSSYPGIALRGHQLGAAFAMQNGSTSGNYGGFKLYSADSNGGVRLQTWQGDSGSSADRFIIAPDTGYICFGCTSETQALSKVQISSGTLRLAGSGAGIIFPDGSAQTSAAVSPSGYAALAGAQTFSGLNTFTQRINVSSDVVVSGGITYADGTRQTTSGGGNTSSSGGSAGYIPKYSSVSDITPSAIHDGGAGITVASSATFTAPGGIGVRYGVAASTFSSTSTGTFAALAVTGAAEFQKPVNIGIVDISSTCVFTGGAIACTADCQDPNVTGYSEAAPYLLGFGGSQQTSGDPSYPPYLCSPVDNHSVRCAWAAGPKANAGKVFARCSKLY